MKKGDRVRVVKDTAGDIPKRLMRRKGTTVADEMDPFLGEPATIRVKMDNRVKPYTFYVDELEVIHEEE